MIPSLKRWFDSHGRSPGQAVAAQMKGKLHARFARGITPHFAAE